MYFKDKDCITKMKYGNDFAYIFKEDSDFLSTEYKVLLSQNNSCFVKCMRMKFNGKIQLYYFTKGLKPFSLLLPTMEPENFLKIITNLFADIIDVKHNGFLSCQNINIDFDNIYVNPNTFKVSLVYLPFTKRLFDDYSSFENELRTQLVKLISGISTLASNQNVQFSYDLSNGMLSLEDLYKKIKSGNTEAYTAPVVDTSVKKEEKHITLIAMNAPTRVEIAVTKDDFVIGKKPDMVDGVVSFNKMISRVHCRIIRQNNQYYLADLGSANGTYINGTKLIPNKVFAIKNGDVVRLANSDFQVVTR